MLDVIFMSGFEKYIELPKSQEDCLFLLAINNEWQHK